MVLTRGKTHVNTDGRQNHESNDDDIPGDLPSRTENQTGDNSRSFRSENYESMKTTPSSTGSPVLVHIIPVITPFFFSKLLMATSF